MGKLVNLARMYSSTTGTGTLTLTTAVPGHNTFAAAGVLNGDTVSYAIKNPNGLEVGTGVYTSSGLTLTRNVISSTNSNAAINLTGTSEVFITPNASDFLGLDRLSDPNADRMLFWDDSAGFIQFLTAGTGLVLSGTDLSVDMETGPWTPGFTFATPGNLTMSYTLQNGVYWRIGELVYVAGRCEGSPSYTTASGNFRLTGLPFSGYAGYLQGGALIGHTSGFTYPASRTFPVSRFSGTNYMEFVAFGSAQGSSAFSTTQCPSGVAQQIIVAQVYRRA